MPRPIKTIREYDMDKHATPHVIRMQELEKDIATVESRIHVAKSSDIKQALSNLKYLLIVSLHREERRKI